MKTEVEHYKGIAFIRVSSLPEEQKKLIHDTTGSLKVIKIIYGTELLTDCVQYENYLNWYDRYFQVEQLS